MFQPAVFSGNSRHPGRNLISSTVCRLYAGRTQGSNHIGALPMSARRINPGREGLHPSHGRWCDCQGVIYSGGWHCVHEDPAPYLSIWDYRRPWYPPPAPHYQIDADHLLRHGPTVQRMAPLRCLVCSSRTRVVLEWTICDTCWTRIRWGMWHWLCERLESSIARSVWVFLF